MLVYQTQNRNFPESIQEFKDSFHSESVCLDFLFLKRWPNGFVCPYCNWINEEQLPAKTINCGHCGHPTSITTNTIMHGTKKPLAEWLLCIWWLATSESGSSAKDLQRLLKLSSYQTAWTWLQKLRMAMGAADNKPCQGTIELCSDSIRMNGEKGDDVNILTAAEVIYPSGITGRIKMQIIDHLSSAVVDRFLSKNVTLGSSIIISENDSYTSIDKNRYLPVLGTEKGTPFRIDHLTRSFAIWLTRIHRGAVLTKHLQLYLDEFCFRNNAAMLPNAEAIFQLLLSGVLSQKSQSYKTITSSSKE